MKRVLTSLAMMAVLLLTLTGFVSNAYQKAAGYFLTSDLGTKIRESINNQIREDLFPLSGPISSISLVKITLSGFPHQTGESVTPFVKLDGTPYRLIMPGIGAGIIEATLGTEPETSLHIIGVAISSLPGQTRPSMDLFNAPFPRTEPIDIPGIGSGQATVKLEPLS